MTEDFGNKLRPELLETLEEARAKLEESIQQAERGELYTEAEVREYMRQAKAEFLRNRKR